VLGLLTAITVAVTPATAQASGVANDGRAEGAAAQAEVFLGAKSHHWPGDGYAEIAVYRNLDGNNHRKHLTACDYSLSHGIGLAIQIDPSGPQLPINYYDPTPQAGFCHEYNIYYSVRKWRFISVYHDGTTHEASRPWEIDPLPYADF
jgi:hypothetical protein